MGYRLSVDFGTTNTAAAIGIDGRPPTSLRLGARSDTIPSAVTLYQGRLLVGDEALRLRMLDASAHEPTPKRRLGAGSIVLGGQRVDVRTLVAMVLAEVWRQAVQRMNGATPDRVLLTYPQAWATPRQDQLYAAALDAGYPPAATYLVSEPVSAAWYYSTSTPLRPGDQIGVVDFGGGTFDVAVLRYGPAAGGGLGFAVQATDGIDPLGGHDFDAQLSDWVIDQLGLMGRRDLLDELDAPTGLAARLTLQDQVREAKHALSQYESAPIVVAAGTASTVLTITANEFDAMIVSAIHDTTRMTADTLSSVGAPGPDPSAGVKVLYLTGGSSLLRLVQRSFQELTRGKVAQIDDPKQVTSLGALAVPGLVPYATARSGPYPVPPGGGGPAPRGPGSGRTPGGPLPVPPHPAPHPRRRAVVAVVGAVVIAMLLVVGAGLLRSTIGGGSPSVGPPSGDPPSAGPSQPCNGMSQSDCATAARAAAVVDLATCSYDSDVPDVVSCSPLDATTLSPDAIVYLYTRSTATELTSAADQLWDRYGITASPGTDYTHPPAKSRYTIAGVDAGLVYTLVAPRDQAAVIIWSVDDDGMLYHLRFPGDSAAAMEWWKKH